MYLQFTNEEKTERSDKFSFILYFSFLSYELNHFDTSIQKSFLFWRQHLKELFFFLFFLLRFLSIKGKKGFTFNTFNKFHVFWNLAESQDYISIFINTSSRLAILYLYIISSRFWILGVGVIQESWAMFYILYHSAEMKGRIPKLNVVSKSLEGLLALYNVTVGTTAAVFPQEGYRKKS